MKVRRLEIRSRHLVEDLFAGRSSSVFKGRGMEFEEVAPLRRRATKSATSTGTSRRASAQPYVKRFVEERELTRAARGRRVALDALRHRGSREARAGGRAVRGAGLRGDHQQRPRRAAAARASASSTSSGRRAGARTCCACCATCWARLRGPAAPISPRRRASSFAPRGGAAWCSGSRTSRTRSTRAIGGCSASATR